MKIKLLLLNISLFITSLSTFVPPIAMDDTDSTNEDTPVSAPTRAEGVLANDQDVDSGEASLLIVSTFGTATDGTGNNSGATISIGDATFTLSTTGTWSFNPSTEYDNLTAGEFTTETFYYVVEDPS